MGINFRELKTTIFRENKLSRILENRIFRGIKLWRICQNSRKSRKFLPHYFLPLKYVQPKNASSHSLIPLQAKLCPIAIYKFQMTRSMARQKRLYCYMFHYNTIILLSF